MRSIAIRVGIIGAIIIGALILRPYLTGDAGGLQVGDCFELPTTVEQEVDDVQHRQCTDPHGAEVVFVGDYEPATDVYPTDAEFFTFFEGRCTAAFNSYTGLDFATAEEYDMAAFTPTTEGWADDDRKVICYAVKIDETQLTQSIKKT